MGLYSMTASKVLVGKLAENSGHSYWALALVQREQLGERTHEGGA